MTVSTCGPDTDFNSQVAVYSGDCNELGGLELLGANDNQPGGCPDFFSAATLTLCAEPGSTVLIQVDAGSTFGGDIFNLSITEELDNEVCACEQPDIDPEFIIVSTFPICEGEGAPGYGLSFFAFENLGSSENLVYEYSYPGQPEPSPAIVEVPAGGEVTVDDVIPLGTTVNFTLTLSDPACEGVGLFPFSGAVAQPLVACDPDCEGVAGGGADPGTACETDEGLPGIYDADCNCQATPANDLPCNAEVLECGDVTSGSTVAASTSDDFCDFSSASGAVWYQYTATGNGTVTIETCLEGTDFDTDSHVFTGSCEDLVCYDGYGGSGYVDGNSACAFTSWSTGGEFAVESGETYWIMIDGFGTLSGNFELSLTCEFDDEVSIDGSVNWNSNCGEGEQLHLSFTKRVRLTLLPATM